MHELGLPLIGSSEAQPVLSPRRAAEAGKQAKVTFKVVLTSDIKLPYRTCDFTLPPLLCCWSSHARYSWAASTQRLPQSATSCSLCDSKWALEIAALLCRLALTDVRAQPRVVLWNAEA